MCDIAAYRAKVILAYLNWAAPCLWTSSDQKIQAGLMGSLVGMPGGISNIGVYLLPSYVRDKGTMWKAEEADGSHCVH